MNTNKTFVVMGIVALLLGACAPAPTSAPIVPITAPESIGRISAEEKLVESGTTEKLVPVTDTADFFDNDTVRVTNGGVAKLDLFADQIDNQISILIFNDTAVGDVKADPSGTANPAVRMQLVFGGLTGVVPKNGGIPIEFETPNGVKIYILGTQFMVLYDPETATTYVGNFDGTVVYSIPGQSVQFTQAGQLYEISSSFEVSQSTLNFTRTDIEDLASSTRSRLLDLLKDYLVPTATPTPTTSPAPTPTITLTPTPAPPCDKAAFVADVTVPDGTSFSPGFQFTKVWRLRNVGTCTWTTGYSLVFYRREQMSGPISVSIPTPVAPGQTVDVVVSLVAPMLPGSYRGDWMLRSPSGALFGAGVNGTTPIWVTVNVISPVTITPVGLPDLTVSITSGPTATCNPNFPLACFIITTVGFAITNTSQVNVTSRFQVLIEATGLQSQTITVDGLAAGSSQNFTPQFSGSCFSNSSCTARITVESGNIVPELNETNNVAENTVTRITTGTITGTAFFDQNGNQIPDSGETRPDFTVTLYDSTGNTLLASTATDANGVYRFPNLSAGTYYVKWVADTECGPRPGEAIVTLNPGATRTQNISLGFLC